MPMVFAGIDASDSGIKYAPSYSARQPGSGGLFAIRSNQEYSHPEERDCMENIEQRVRKIVAEQLGVNEADVKNESSFVSDLGADSLDTVELVMALEEEFETEIPDEEAEKITTVQQAVDYIKTHQKS